MKQQHSPQEDLIKDESIESPEKPDMESGFLEIIQRSFPVRMLALLAFLGISETAFAKEPPFQAVKGNIKGSRTALLHENHRADQLGFKPFENAKEIQAALKAGKLVRVKDTNSYYVDPHMGNIDPRNKELYRTLRPHAKQLLDAVAQEFYKRFQTRLKVTGLNRTEDYVDRLREVNGNASAISSHMRGTTIDLAYTNLDAHERHWLEAKLVSLEKQGRVQFTKEWQQTCYHFMVTEAPTKKKIQVASKDKKNPGKTIKQDHPQIHATIAKHTPVKHKAVKPAPAKTRIARR